MSINISVLLMLAVFSGLSMNLILQFGLALKGIAFDSRITRERLLTGSGILLVTIMALWLIFSLGRSLLGGGGFEYVALFPVGTLVFCCFEYVTNRFILKKTAASSSDSPEALFDATLCGGTFSGGALSGAAVFIMLNVAGGIFDALALSLGFSASVALVFVIVAEIRRKSEMEAIPHWLRGGPLALIALGLLSLIFSSGALVLFEVWGTR